MPRNKRRSAGEWASIVDEFCQGQETQGGFCARRQLKELTFQAWRLRFGVKKSGTPRVASSTSEFVEVRPVADGGRCSVTITIGANVSVDCADRDQIQLAVELIRALHHET